MEPDCVFCDRTKFEEQLIGETKNSWIIATLGQITDGGYVLLVPKQHIECVGAADSAGLADDFTNVYFAVFNQYKILPIIFEHGIIGQTVKHAHLHFVPTTQEGIIGPRIRKDFPGSKIEKILPPWPPSEFLRDLCEIYKKKEGKYLFWIDYEEFLGGQPYICWNPLAPPQYLRIVVAEALGRPERANWRNMDPELDKRLWSETVRRLKPHFS